MLQQRLRRAARAGKALTAELGVEAEVWKDSGREGGKFGSLVCNKRSGEVGEKNRQPPEN